jgi:hypothetical protein
MITPTNNANKNPLIAGPPKINIIKTTTNNVMDVFTVLLMVLFNESLITTGPGPNPLPFEHRVFFLFGFQKKAVTFSPGYHVRFGTPNFGNLRINHGFVLWINWNYNFKNFKKHSLKEFPADKM